MSERERLDMWESRNEEISAVSVHAASSDSLGLPESRRVVVEFLDRDHIYCGSVGRHLRKLRIRNMKRESEMESKRKEDGYPCEWGEERTEEQRGMKKSLYEFLGGPFRPTSSSLFPLVSPNLHSVAFLFFQPRPDDTLVCPLHLLHFASYHYNHLSSISFVFRTKLCPRKNKTALPNENLFFLKNINCPKDFQRYY